MSTDSCTDTPVRGRKVLAFAFGATGYRGVHWDAERQLYRAEIGNRYRGTLKRLGRFAEAKDAAEAYDSAAMELYGDEAVLNFPLAGYKTVIPVTDVPKQCASGHALDSANLYVDPAGRRQCRACNRAAANRYYRRKIEAGRARQPADENLSIQALPTQRATRVVTS